MPLVSLRPVARVQQEFGVDGELGRHALQEVLDARVAKREHLLVVAVQMAVNDLIVNESLGALGCLFDQLSTDAVRLPRLQVQLQLT